MPAEQGSMYIPALTAAPRMEVKPMSLAPPSVNIEAVSFFTPQQMKLLSERPILNLFLSELTNFDGNKLETAAHETNHALCDPENVVAISVQPNGNILGFTLFRKVPDVATTAAGMVDTPYGKASGTGGDQLQLIIHALQRGANPNTLVSSSKKAASERLSKIPDEVKKLLSKAIAIRGRVSGIEFRQLKAQAEWEHKWITLFPHLPVSLIKSQLRLKTTTLQPSQESDGMPQIPNIGKYILVVDKNDGTTELSEFADGVLVGKTKIICRRCGGEGGHSLECKANPANQNDRFSFFPPNGLIFGNKSRKND